MKVKHNFTEVENSEESPSKKENDAAKGVMTIASDAQGEKGIFFIHLDRFKKTTIV